MMKELLLMVLAFIAGILLGILFFYGLWLTLRRAFKSKIPAFWLLGSFVARTGITLTGFYYVSMGNWEYLIVCLVGFVLGRYIVSHFTKPDLNEIQLKKEVGYET